MAFPDAPKSLVAPLLKEVTALAERKVVDVSSLLMHILANTTLVSPRYIVFYHSYDIDLSSGQESAVHKLEVIFRGRLNFNDMRHLYQVIKGKSGSRQLKWANAKHLELYRLVDKKGGPPAKGVVAFWKEVMTEWNQGHSEDIYTTWKGVKIAYDRLMNRSKKRIDLVKGN